MALNDLLKKIAIKNLDCKGIYFKDISSIFKDKQTLTQKDMSKLNYQNISIVLKIYFRNKTIKKTLKYNNLTGLDAVKKASIERSKLKEEVETTGTIKKESFKSLNELKESYFKLKDKTFSKHYKYSQEKNYDKWIKNRIGNYEINKIIGSDIQMIVNNILNQGKTPRTALTIVQILRPIFYYAIDIGLCEKNPAIKVTIPKFDNIVDFQLPDEKRKKLYHEILKYEPIKYRGIMLFLYFGRRINEVITLKWENIDFEHKVYVIEDKYSKIRRRQEYPLLKSVEDYLTKLGIKKSGYIFKGKTTPHITRDTFKFHWKKLLKNACIEKMRVHDTRHLLGNTMVNKGESLEAIGRVLGHSSTQVTKRYAKTSLNTANNVLNSYLED